jgi:hypothetical protein
LPIDEYSSSYEEAPVDATIDRLRVALTAVIDLAVPSGHVKKHRVHPRFSEKLKFIIKYFINLLRRLMRFVFMIISLSI